ncbi:MAG: hypothetical protein M1834_007803 [Cirrosporium novae-zelandiae]|nr:MAG: hypothetical protein M1834_007803 [Cirrosporium novae-zelandiae]
MKGAWEFLLLTAAIHGTVSAADVPRPRGVGPEFSKYYTNPEVFTCLSNPSISFPLSRINDDYCDCPDGSDEPGTSACSYLTPHAPHFPSDVPAGAPSNSTLALPGFWCKNKGHIGQYVPFERINDGLCDYDYCCDGSDEWDAVGGVKCEDKCKAMHKEWKKLDDARQKSRSEAIRQKKELMKEAARLKKETEDHIDDLEKQIEAAAMKVNNLEIETAEVEKKELGKMIKSSVGKGSRITALASLAKQRVEELRSKLSEVKAQRDDQTARVKELEGILAAFKEEYNPNFNDEGVKRAVRSWEDYAAREKTADPEAAKERDLEEILKEDNAENGINWVEWETEADTEDSEVDILYNLSAYLPPSLNSWINTKLLALRLWAITNGILAVPSSSTGAPSTSAVLEAAKKNLKAAQDDLSNLRDSLTSHHEDLTKDYGPDGVFRALKDRCVSTDVGEYTYELCFLAKTQQKPKKSGGSQNMGKFVRFDRIIVDEEVSPDGKGLGVGERWIMVYDNGAHCWNGPNRRTTIVMACAETEAIWKVREEEKCVYRMEVGTPAVCEVEGNGAKEAKKDEL